MAGPHRLFFVLFLSVAVLAAPMPSDVSTLGTYGLRALFGAGWEWTDDLLGLERKDATIAKRSYQRMS
jgi:hypothetical protein